MMVKDEECVFKMAMSSVVEEVPGRRLKRRVRLPISKRAREMIAASAFAVQKPFTGPVVCIGSFASANHKHTDV